MSRVRSNQYDDQDEIFWSNGQEFRKRQSAKDRNKQRKSQSIRQGIDDYWGRQKFYQNIFDSYDDIDDMDNLDEFESKH